MKKFVSLCATLSMMLSMLGTLPVVADSTATDVEIATLAEFEAFRDDVNSGNTYEGKTVKLTNDIDMSEKYGEGKGSWTPIGSFDWENPMPFSGTFDGGGHKIYNLYYYDGTEIYDENKPVGLFIYNLGTIKNLGVEGSITHMRYSVAGGIAAISDANGMIENCYFSGSITSPAHVGGITGYGNIKNCYNTGTIKGFHCVGGLTGTDSNIINCYNVGNVIKMTEEDTSLFWESECLGSISGASSSVSAMSDCFYLEGTYSVGTFAGENTDPTIALTLEQFADKTNFTNWDFETVWEMDDTLKRPVLRFCAENTDEVIGISTLAELEAFRDDVNSGNTYEGKTVKLTADINMSEKYGEGKESWTPIGYNDWDTDTHKPFSGMFEGGGHTISGLYINTETDRNTGLFAIVDGTVQNLNVKGYILTTHMDGCAAGLVQQIGENGRILDCSFDGVVESRNYVAAGIASANLGLISGCKFSGKVIGWHLTGAIASNGSEESIIKNCINEGEITVNLCGGGIVGWGNRIENCINTGKITGISRSIEGYEPDTSWGVGGIAGVLGVGGEIENCYNTGAIWGNSEVGGIIGTAEEGWTDNQSLAQVKNCYNIGSVTSTMEKQDGEYNIGAIIGNREYITPFDEENDTKVITSEAVDCYYLIGTADKGCGGNADDITTALTLEQFADKSNFVNWDFETVWEMDDTLKRPVLRSNKENPPIEINEYQIKYENEKAVVTVPQDGTYAIIFAAYDSGGRLLSVSAQNVPLIQGENEPIEPKPDFNKNGPVKVMLWNGFNNLKPLCSPDRN